MFIDKAVSGLGELTPAQLAEASVYNLNPKVKFSDKAFGVEHFKKYMSPEERSKYAYSFQVMHDDLVNDGKLGPLTVAKLISEADRVESPSGEYSDDYSESGQRMFYIEYPNDEKELNSSCGKDDKESCYTHGILPFYKGTAIKASRRRPQPGPKPVPVPDIDNLPEPLQAGAGPNVGLLALGGVLLFAAYRSFQGKPLLPGMK